MQLSGVNNPMEAAKWGKTPLIQKKAAEATKNAMTDDFIEKLKELARKDAANGISMGKEYMQLCHSQMEEYNISPDRSAPMAQMSQELQKAAREHKEQEDPRLVFLDRMLAQLKKTQKYRIVRSFSGLEGGCSGDLHSTPENQVATVYSPDGEMIAGYNTSSGGWQILTTKAESQFLGDANIVYMQAYKAALAEINAAAQKPMVDQKETSFVDVRA